ncbi:hypothetical protein JCM7447_12370 [Corynebacterium amycolatum]
MGSMPAERRMCSREGEVEAKTIRGLLIISDFSEGGIVKPNFCGKHAWGRPDCKNAQILKWQLSSDGVK